MRIGAYLTAQIYYRLGVAKMYNNNYADKSSVKAKTINIKDHDILDLNPSCFLENLTEARIKREQEILQSPLVRSIKRSKLLFDDSLTVDDHYSDSLV